MSESAITIYEGLQASPLEAAEKMGKFFANSGLFGCEKPEQGMVLALACMCERKNPLDIARTYHIVNNRLSMRADAMLAKFRGLGGKVVWKQFDTDAAIGVWTFDNNKDVEIGYTKDDATKAKLLPAKPGSGWDKDPSAMLRARVISKALRMLAPEVIAGMYTPEEIGDFDPSRTVAAEVVAPAPEAALLKKGPGRPKKTEGEVIDATPEPAKPVEAKAEEKPAEPAPAPKAEEKPAPVAAPAKAAEKPKAEENPLPDKLALVLEIIGDKKAEVEKYLLEKQLIPKGAKLKDMPDAFMDRIAAKPDAFMRAVAAGKAPTQKA